MMWGDSYQREQHGQVDAFGHCMDCGEYVNSTGGCIRCRQTVYPITIYYWSSDPKVYEAWRKAKERT
jgi:hypothetical protein